MASETCRIGSIYYSDGTCLSPENHQSNKTVLGVVVYVTDGGLHGQVLSPWTINKDGIRDTSSTIMWSIDENTSVNPNSSDPYQDFNSCYNTGIITSKGNDYTYPAAWAARKYAPVSGTQGKWCLPAAGILNNIYTNRDMIEISMNKIQGKLQLDGAWSSTEYGRDYAIVFYTSYLTNDNKKVENLVQPVLEF